MELIPYMLELADYYCLDDLKQIMEKYAFELYQKKIKSKKTSAHYILDGAYSLNKMQASYGEYVCFYALVTLISHFGVEDLE